MINTIFYFPESLTFEDYVSKLASGDIASRTIVFADAQKAIYNRGKKYGGLSTSEFHDMVDSLYDDSWIKDEIDAIKSDILLSSGRIDDLNTRIATINSNLNTTIGQLDTRINTNVAALLNDINYLRQNFNKGIIDWKQEWDSEIGRYLNTVGYYDTDDFGNQIYKWSKLQQQINSLSGSVTSLVTSGTLSEALISSIEAIVSGQISQLNLGSTYARIDDLNGVKNVIEWLYAGLKTQADPISTFAEISAAGRSTISSAISNIRTYVEKLQNGDYVAQTEVNAKVRNTIVTLLAQAENDNALAALAAKADANSADIAALLLGMTGSSSTADIQTRVSSALSGFLSTADLNSAKSEIYSAISAKDANDNFISLAALKTAVDNNTASISAISTNGTDTSGFVSRAGLGEAVSELFASSGNGQSADAKASVVALVRDNKSQLQLSAEDVNINGYLTGGNATFRGDVHANSFITGEDDESGISVMSGQFDSTRANTNKAYFAYDSAQGAVTMWFYQSGTWKCIDLSETVYTPVNEGFITHTVYTLNENQTVLPSSPTQVNIYESRVSGKYYVSADSTSNYATGVYYTINRYRSTVEYWYRGQNVYYGQNPHTNVEVPWDQIGENRKAPNNGYSIVPTVDGQSANYDPSAQNSRYFAETLPAAEVTKFAIDNDGYLQNTNTNTVKVFYQVSEHWTYDYDGDTQQNVAINPQADPTTGTYSNPETTSHAWCTVKPMYVKSVNLSGCYKVLMLNGSNSPAPAVSNTSNPWGSNSARSAATCAYVPCTLGDALTHNAVGTDLGNMNFAYPNNTLAGPWGYTEYYD